MQITKEQIEKLREDIDGVDLDESLGIFGEFSLTVQGRCPHCNADFYEDTYDHEEVKVDCNSCNLKFTVHLREDDPTEAQYITIDEEQG